MCSQGWEARLALVAAYSNLNFKLGYSCRVNPLVLEELGKNADSASFRFRQPRNLYFCAASSPSAPSPRPVPGLRRPRSETSQRKPGAKRGADPARQVTEARSWERGAVELIGVLAQTGWVLMRPEGTPPGTR